MSSDLTGALEAGGLLPTDAALPVDAHVDALAAHTYTHAAIPGRVVVRLVPDALAAGADTEMALLGFARSARQPDVALQQRRTLGFPAWCLVHDPERARYALDVLKRFQVEAKRAKTKPGHARDGFKAIADDLQRKVPHFLPSFWEEAGRTFITVGNQKLAATCFDTAREAEASFNLAVDVHELAETTLEFALAGALTVKTLQGHGKELQKILGPDAAYERYYTLVVRRTLGGVTPWASMSKDVRALAKAAGRDLAVEDDRLIADIIDSPALTRAGAGFWKDYEPAIGRLCRASPKVARRILELLPAGSGSTWRTDDAFQEAWIDLLARAGVLEPLWTEGADPERLPRDGRAAWIGAVHDWLHDGSNSHHPILRRMAPLLVAEGAPVPAASVNWKGDDPDWYELLLALKVPFAWPQEDGGVKLALTAWASWPAAPARPGLPAEPRRKDPVHLAADPTGLTALCTAIGDAMGDEAFERVAGDMLGYREARRRWLSDRIGEIRDQGLLSAHAALQALAGKTTAATYQHFPELREAIAALDLARPLAATLRAGLIDEVGWDAWDQALADLPTGKNENRTVRAWFPWMVVANAARAIVLGPTGSSGYGRVFEHDLRVPKGKNVQSLHWSAGQLRVAWWGDGGHAGYWSGNPSEIVPFDHSYAWGEQDALAVQQADGAISLGHKPIRPGDTKAPDVRKPLFHDATGVWCVERAKGEENHLEAVDLTTDTLLGPDAPAFLADVPGPWLAYGRYHPVPGGTPFGQVDGVHGLKTADGQRWTRIDGRTFDGRIHPLFGFMDWPGDSALRPVSGGRGWRSEGITLRDPTGAWIACQSADVEDDDDDDEEDAEDIHLTATPAPPVAFWHCVRPRDPAASAVLRQLTDARPLLTLHADEAGLARALDALPARHPLLRTAITAHVRFAAKLEGRWKKLCASLAGALHEAPSRQAPIDDSAAQGALAGLVTQAWGHGSLTGALVAAGRFFAGGDADADPPSTALMWPDWFGRMKALLWSGSRPGVSDAQREHAARILEAWADAGLEEGSWRVFDGLVAAGSPFAVTRNDQPRPFWYRVDGDRRFAVRCLQTYGAGPWGVKVVEKLTGPPAAPPTGVVIRYERLATGGGAAWLREAAAALRARGARAARADDVAVLAEQTGLTRSEATLVLACLPNFHAWGADFLGKELRLALGLKQADAKAARTALKSAVGPGFMQILHDAAPADPLALWSDDPHDPEGPILRLARAWVAHKGKRVPVPEALLVAASKELSGACGFADLFADLQDPSRPAWTQDKAPVAAPTSTEDDDEEVDDEDAPASDGGFDEDHARAVAEFVPWLVHALPARHPLLARLPRWRALLLERLSFPDLLVDEGSWYLENAKQHTAFDAFFTAIGAAPVKVDDTTTRADNGVVMAERTKWNLNLSWRPAKADEATRELVRRFLASRGEPLGHVHLFAWLQGPDFAAIVERAVDSPVPDGGWEHDPRASASAVVDEVVAAKGLSRDAAALWLQTMALPAPTKKDVLTWNAWTPAQYAAAARELVAAGLLLEGKRERAGREVFLPGGWDDKVPTETWKLPLYQLDGLDAPFGRKLPLEPIHALFARVWARVKAGDAPRFEEVRR